MMHNLYTTELLLNLIWLALTFTAGMAWWLRRRPAGNFAAGYGTVLAIGCLVALVFPVVSVSDDLYALRGEIEETTPCASSVKKSASSSSLYWSDGSQPAVVAGSGLFSLEQEFDQAASTYFFGFIER